jgi:murein DD-endopeptidase MepM/ murein hydrolase activator NlpD
VTVPDVKQMTLPSGEIADPKTIASKVTGMFMEMMLKSMEDNVDAEDGLFGNSSSSEIYRGMIREKMASTMAEQISSPFEKLLAQGIHSKMPASATPATDGPDTPTPQVPAPTIKTPTREKSTLPVKGVISSPIGWRKDPIDGGMKFHKGTDIAAPYGSAVNAMADGIVVESGAKGGYGNAVVVQLADGSKMLYGHNSVNLVQVGDRVQQGDVIAQVGATGRATGPHVHFELIAADPKVSLKFGNGPSDNTSGKDFHQPTTDGPGAQNE